MQARMSNIVEIVPEAMQALMALGKCAQNRGVPSKTIGLVQLHASQINGCSVCVDMHPRYMKEAGETDARLVTVAAWRDAPYFTDAESLQRRHQAGRIRQASGARDRERSLSAERRAVIASTGGDRTACA